jgi:transcriptional regulator with XRE-family HTH domain
MVDMTPNELRQIVAKNIKARRVELGITQEALADSIGTSQSYVSQLEKGRESPNLEMLAKLADALGTQPDILVRGESFLAIPA